MVGTAKPRSRGEDDDAEIQERAPQKKKQERKKKNPFIGARERD